MIERTRPVAAARSTTDAALYDRVARDSAARVIHHYSSSFGLASRLLAQPVRDHVRTIYHMSCAHVNFLGTCAAFDGVPPNSLETDWI
jgi:hypothetical protein